jgi:pyrroloquinoline-quinone synthase
MLKHDSQFLEKGGNMTNEQFIQELNRILDEKSILKHPFYQKWNEGKLTIHELQEYARQYYHFVKHFPMFVSSVHSNCTDVDVRRMLVENIADEDGFNTGVEDHPHLWLKFAAALNVNRTQCGSAPVCPEVQDSIDGFYKLCRNSDYRIGLGALYGYEKQIPEVSRVKIDGLKKFYNMEGSEAIKFFTVHHEADIHHSGSELQALLDTCGTDEQKQKALDAARKSAALYWQMLDGVYVN